MALVLHDEAIQLDRQNGPPKLTCANSQYYLVWDAAVECWPFANCKSFSRRRCSALEQLVLIASLHAAAPFEPLRDSALAEWAECCKPLTGYRWYSRAIPPGHTAARRGSSGGNATAPPRGRWFEALSFRSLEYANAHMIRAGESTPVEAQQGNRVRRFIELTGSTARAGEVAPRRATEPTRLRRSRAPRRNDYSARS